MLNELALITVIFTQGSFADAFEIVLNGTKAQHVTKKEV